MMSLYVQAPFAACRTFTAGWYRPTATFLTPSAAYGLILNVAGVESRLREEDDRHDGKVPATLTRSGLPPRFDSPWAHRPLMAASRTPVSIPSINNSTTTRSEPPARNELILPTATSTTSHPFVASSSLDYAPSSSSMGTSISKTASAVACVVSSTLAATVCPFWATTPSSLTDLRNCRQSQQPTGTSASPKHPVSAPGNGRRD